MQTDLDIVHLLPALPRDWPTGAVRGFRLRGITLDLRWRDRAVEYARFVATRATTLRLVVPAECVVELPGTTADGVTTFALAAGEEVSVARS